MRPLVRPAIPSDLDKFITNPLPYRIRAWTGVLGDEVLAVGGIAYLSCETHGAFLMATDKAREYPVTLHKTGLTVLAEARKLGIRKLVALADPEIGAAERWLSRLGFEPTITTDDKQVWAWQQSSQ